MAKKSSASKRKTSNKSQVQSFRVAQPDVPFMTVKPSIQTLYWVILGVVIVIFTVWILKLQSDIQAVYDTLDANERYISEEMNNRSKKSKN